MSEKKEWKVGDSIRVYGFDRDSAQVVYNRKIESIESNGVICTDGGEFCHPKQCRRLTKRPRREFEISCHAPYGVLRIVQFGEPLRNGDVIRVREIKK